MTTKYRVGDAVYEADEIAHVGTIESISEPWRDDQRTARVRWHKGYTTRVTLDRLKHPLKGHEKIFPTE